MPTHLYGKTQHKTLQARVSEDIITKRENSAFFRTAPGRFFLREFLTDASIPEEYRIPVPTRRRMRELVRGPALAIDFHALKSIADENIAISPEKIFDILNEDAYRYEDPRTSVENIVFLRSFVCVFRDKEVLSYRLGRYRDDRDAFMSHRSIGFSALVNIDEHTLFNLGDFGIVDAGVRATKIDLDMPEVQKNSLEERIEAYLNYFIWVRDDTGSNDLLAVINFKCPTWFEPVKRRLALNDLGWLDSTLPFNNVDDFDPWSKSVLLSRYKGHMGLRATFET